MVTKKVFELARRLIIQKAPEMFPNEQLWPA